MLPRRIPFQWIWWRLHETITRNHRCQSLIELVEQVYDWIDQQRTFHTPALTNYPQAA